MTAIPPSRDSAETHPYHYTAETVAAFPSIFNAARMSHKDVLQHFADAGFAYHPTVSVDTSLHPYSEEYVSQQVALYEEISGRKLDQVRNEQFPIDVDGLVAMDNLYADQATLHVSRLAKAFWHAEVRCGGRVIDFGPGVGVSCELAAFLGYDVTGIDINPDYVEVINRRAERRGFKIKAKCSAFEDANDGAMFDGAIFYESLHHAVRPWLVLRQACKLLKPDGKLILVGEPINEYWWPTWGMRLDSVSVSCMREWGWFESGWSLPFLQQMLVDVGLTPVVIPDADPSIGPVVIGLMPEAKIAYRLEAPPKPVETKAVTRTRLSTLRSKIFPW